GQVREGGGGLVVVLRVALQRVALEVDGAQGGCDGAHTRQLGEGGRRQRVVVQPQVLQVRQRCGQLARRLQVAGRERVAGQIEHAQLLQRRQTGVETRQAVVAQVQLVQ